MVVLFGVGEDVVAEHDFSQRLCSLVKQIHVAYD